MVQTSLYTNQSSPHQMWSFLLPHFFGGQIRANDYLNGGCVRSKGIDDGLKVKGTLPHKTSIRETLRPSQLTPNRLTFWNKFLDPNINRAGAMQPPYGYLKAGEAGLVLAQGMSLCLHQMPPARQVVVSNLWVFRIFLDIKLFLLGVTCFLSHADSYFNFLYACSGLIRLLL